MSNLTKRGTPRKRAAVGSKNRPTELGALLRQARVQRGLSQTTLGKALEKQAKTTAGNAKLSTIELGKAIPNDAEVTVLAHQLGLSVASLRTKRDEAEKLHAARRAAGRRRGIAKRKESMLAKRAGSASSLLAPKAPERKAAKRVSAQDAAGAPVLADFVEIVDALVPMPIEKEARRRWFAATMDLYKINGGKS